MLSNFGEAKGGSNVDKDFMDLLNVITEFDAIDGSKISLKKKQFI